MDNKLLPKIRNYHKISIKSTMHWVFLNTFYFGQMYTPTEGLILSNESRGGVQWRLQDFPLGGTKPLGGASAAPPGSANGVEARPTPYPC